MRSARHVGWRMGVPAMVIVIAALSMAPTGGTVLSLRSAGVVVEADGALTAVPPDTAARFVPGSNVLTSTDLTNAAVAKQVERDRAWLRAGQVPGAGTAFTGMAKRALLDLRALTDDTGAVIAAPVTSWKHVWPRDASFVAAAYSVTGHHDDAADVLGFLARVAPPDGRWEARYRVDGSGPPDDRPGQLDGAGWTPWAVWLFVKTAPEPEMTEAMLEVMRPAVLASADAIVESLGEDGLPEPSSDYWEKSESDTTLGTAAPLSLGLRAAIDLAPALNVDATQWREAARRLDTAVTERFGENGYPRTLPDGGADAAVTFLAPPFAPVDDAVAEAVREAERKLRVPNGGHRPGEAWSKDVGVAWTPETALLALALAGNGDRAAAERLLTFLDEHRTQLGSLPEKVDVESKPASVAPLAWTSALVVLTLAELEHGLPTPPAVG